LINRVEHKEHKEHKDFGVDGCFLA
jgi:hypothetical protein